jgi:hypothetical protein
MPSIATRLPSALPAKKCLWQASFYARASRALLAIGALLLGSCVPVYETPALFVEPLEGRWKEHGAWHRLYTPSFDYEKSLEGLNVRFSELSWLGKPLCIVLTATDDCGPRHIPSGLYD